MIHDLPAHIVVLYRVQVGSAEKMGSGPSIPADKHIVIIGGGYGGKDLAMALIKMNVKVTVIDPKDFFHHNVASVRAFVDKSYSNKMFIPYAPAFGDHLRRGKVTSIDTTIKTVHLEDGSTVTYDVLVIATGSTGPLKEWLLNREQSIEKYSKYPEAVKESKEIVVVGGGPAGVEIATEIASTYSDKKVTVVQGSGQLIHKTAPPNFIGRIDELLKQMNVTVILDEKVENLADLPNSEHGLYELKTNKGTVLKADLVIKAHGVQINTSAFQSSFADHMEPNGTLRVNPFLQVEGFTDVFAIGDCNNLEPMKLAFIAGLESQHLVKNLPKYFNNAAMAPWNSSCITAYMALSMGREHAVGCTPGGWMLPEFFLVRLKSRDMMLDKFYKEMNQTLPQ